jgi:sugar O-acyltransferase (sialic acid O-acetyltransferase NeuD family)
LAGYELLENIQQIMKKTILFGNKPSSQMVAYQINRDGGSVVAFVVDEAFITDTHIDDIPVVSFEDMPQRFDPLEYEVLVFLGPRNQNKLRADVCNRVEAAGFHLGSYVSKNAWIWGGLTIQPNTKIGDRTIVQPFSQIGKNVMIGSGCIIGHHSNIADHCFIASGVILGGSVSIGPGCFIGTGCIIRDKVSIGAGCVIGAGVTLQENAEARSVYMNTSSRKMPFNSDEINL